MSTTIMDGTGSSLRAKVISDGADNRLLVSAESFSGEGSRAQQGKTGIVHAVCTFGATSSGGLLAITNNSTDKSIAITRIYIDAHLLAAPVEILQVKQPSFSGGVLDANANANVQKNYGSQFKHPLGVTVATSGNAMTYSGGEQYHDFAMSSLQSQQRNMNATNVIAPSTTFFFGFDTSRVGGHNMGANETISFSVNYIPES